MVLTGTIIIYTYVDILENELQTVLVFIFNKLYQNGNRKDQTQGRFLTHVMIRRSRK